MVLKPSRIKKAVQKTAKKMTEKIDSSGEAVLWQPKSIPQTLAMECEADELFYGGAAGGGKALSIYSIIPTPNGYKQMLDLRNGDEVFGMNGNVYRIIGTSEVMYDHRVFDVVFDDGTIIRADGDHKWYTFTYAERSSIRKRSPEYRQNRREKRVSRSTGKRPDLALRNSQVAQSYIPKSITGGVRTTLEIRDSLFVGKRSNHAIPIADPLQLPNRELPINPYILGFWLGDGSSYAGRITVGDNYIEDTKAIFLTEGYEITKIPSDKQGYTVRGLQKLLRLNGFLKNKHIPDEYLLGSFEQRLALLQGLMDTDGFASTSGQCEFYSSKENFIKSVSRLLHTLGIKHAIRPKKAPKGTSYSESYRIKFVAPFPVFRLPFKAKRQNLELRDTQKWRYIVDVREVDSEPVKCIAIDSPDHLYLAGEECVPTHNTDLALGLALMQHKKSIIFRRIYKNLKSLIERAIEIVGNKEGLNQSDHVWRDLPGDRQIEFAAMQLENHKFNYKGNPHDLYVFDEASDFTRTQVEFVTAWARTTEEGQRVRIVFAGNPPTSTEGEWIIERFAPWLNPDYPNPAKPGELRWFATVNDKQVERPDGTPFYEGTELITPKSRTFIPAKLDDNPFLRDTGYRSILQSLPEPLRSQLLYGDFTIKATDDIWQCIPTAWVQAAQKRWNLMERPEVTLRAAGVDVARGGKDKTAISRVFSSYFDEVILYPGSETPDGKTGAKVVVDAIPDPKSKICIDVIGVGSSVYDTLRDDWRYESVIPINNGSGSSAVDQSGTYGFANLRAECYWKLREALDPNSGEQIALPDSRELLADLCVPKYKVIGAKYQIEDKDNIKKRIGRSPDMGDAVVMAWWGCLNGSAAFSVVKNEPDRPAYNEDAATVAFYRRMMKDED